MIFSLFNIAMALSVRDEFGTAFRRDILADRRQLMLFGLALLLTWLPTELGFLQSRFGLTSLNGWQWLLAAGLAFGLLLISEVVKFFGRRRHKVTGVEEKPAPVAGPAPA